MFSVFLYEFICCFLSTWISETEAQKNLLESAAEIVQYLNHSLTINQLIFWKIGLTMMDRQMWTCFYFLILISECSFTECSLFL